MTSFSSRRERWIEVSYALMRVILGATFACHGAQKLFGVLGAQNELGDPWGVAAGIIELAGGVSISLGMQTGLAAFIASGEMAVAYFKAHAPRGFWPIMNGGEKAMMFSVAFLFIAARGPGLFSVSGLRKRSHSQR